MSGPATETSDLGDRRLQFAESLRSYYTDVASCLTERGIPTEVAAGGDGIERNLPPGGDGLEASGLDAAFEACSEEAGGMPDRPPPPSEEELRGLYRLNLQVVDCLVEQGLPFDEPPSEDVYVQTYLASLSGGEERPWDPYPDGAASWEGADVCSEPSLVDLYR